MNKKDILDICEEMLKEEKERHEKETLMEINRHNGSVRGTVEFRNRIIGMLEREQSTSSEGGEQE